MDEFNNPVTSTKFSKTGGTASETVVTTYEYDDEHRCVKADASVVISTGNEQVENVPKEVNCKNRTFFFVVAFVRQRFVLLNAEIAA